MRRPGALVALGVALLAGCSDDDEAIDTLPPPTTAPGTVTTTATTVPATTSPSTTTSSTTSTTSTSTTTTVAGPAPSSEAAAVLMGGPGDFAWPAIGWWSGADWVAAGSEGATEIPAAPGDAAQVVSIAGATTAALGDSGEACFEEPGFDVSAAAPELEPGYGYTAVAVNAPWTVALRPAVEAGAAVDEYERLGESLATGLGVDASAGDVAQAVRVDLDGDGTEEVVIAFEISAEPVTGDGTDIALLYARLPQADGTVRDQLLVSSVVPGVDAMVAFQRFRVLGAGDLNGNGVMELLVRDWSFESAGVSVWELTGSALTQVLAGSCGS